MPASSAFGPGFSAPSGSIGMCRKISCPCGRGLASLRRQVRRHRAGRKSSAAPGAQAARSAAARAGPTSSMIMATAAPRGIGAALARGPAAIIASLRVARRRSAGLSGAREAGPLTVLRSAGSGARRQSPASSPARRRPGPAPDAGFHLVRAAAAAPGPRSRSWAAASGDRRGQCRGVASEARLRRAPAPQGLRFRRTASRGVRAALLAGGCTDIGAGRRPPASGAAPDRELPTLSVPPAAGRHRRAPGRSVRCRRRRLDDRTPRSGAKRMNSGARAADRTNATSSAPTPEPGTGHASSGCRWTPSIVRPERPRAQSRV